MKSIYRLKKNYQYNYVYKHATSVADKNFVLLYCASGNKRTKVGFSISKKYGKAVARNRIRRQLKVAVSAVVEQVEVGYNLIFIPRRQGPYLFSEVTSSVGQLLKKSGLMQ